VTKPEGIVAIVKGNEEDIYSLVEELYAKSSKDNVSLYKIEESPLDIEQESRELRLELNEKLETIEKLLSFVLAKQKAVLKFSSPDFPEKIYEATGKKGKAEISVLVREKNNAVNIHLKITGYGPAVESCTQNLKKSLSTLRSKTMVNDENLYLCSNRSTLS